MKDETISGVHLSGQDRELALNDFGEQWQPGVAIRPIRIESDRCVFSPPVATSDALEHAIVVHALERDPNGAEFVALQWPIRLVLVPGRPLGTGMLYQ
jgi:hypothetical protein